MSLRTLPEIGLLVGAFVFTIVGALVLGAPFESAWQWIKKVSRTYWRSRG